MRILIALTYYRPHYSGLTIYTERLARALAARGHQVTVLTSQFDAELLAQEEVDGVEVVRLPVWKRISKGVLMPRMPLAAWEYARRAEVVNLHLPQLDAAPIALLSRLLGKPVVLTYHCDLLLPQGLVHRIANLVSNVANAIAALAAKRIVTNTLDYAENSRFLRRHRRKIRAIPPPAQLPSVSEGEVEAFKRKSGIKVGEQVIGMVGRLAAEKGAEHLIRALPRVLEHYPQARVLHAGQYEEVMGEERYAKELAPLVAELGEHWKFLGLIPDEELAAMYHACEVVALPSTNSTESFGIVQVEAMTCGTPAVASDMPGLRQPILTHGTGVIFPTGNEAALAEAIVAVLDSPAHYRGEVEAITSRYAPDTIAAEYEALFQELL